MLSSRKRIADFRVLERQSLRSIMGRERALWLNTRTLVVRINRLSGQIAAGTSRASNASIKTRHWCSR